MITVYGASDDLIEVEGAIREEFDYQYEVDPDVEAGDLIACSDGTVLRVAYSRTGVWRIALVAKGTAKLTITPAPERDDDNYSDRAQLDGEIEWVVHGIHFAAKK